jgi:hypothetical protein
MLKGTAKTVFWLIISIGWMFLLAGLIMWGAK